MRHTETTWNYIAKEGYPSTDEFGPYPCVMVAMACEGQPDWGPRMEMGELRFFGGDKSRPYWCSPFKSQSHAPIENSSWHVVAWAPLHMPPWSAK